MKKILCMILAVGMLCAAAVFVGCKKDDNKGNGGRGSEYIGNESGVPVPPTWG